MLEHLDDPAPPEVGVRQLGSVLARSADRRRHRSRRTFGALGVAILVAGVAIGIALPRGGTTISVANLALQEDDLAPGTVVPALHLSGAVFPDDRHGFALTTGASHSALVETSDGGSTWVVVDGRLPVSSVDAQLDFTDVDHGYLWGGQSPERKPLPLWVTSDGGRTWLRAPIGPVVSDVSAIGSSVWAVAGGCQDPAPATCPVTLEQSSDGGITWAPSDASPGIVEAALPSFGDQNVELARMSVEHAYLLTYGVGSEGPGLGRLVYTADGGSSWTSLPDPCPAAASASELAGSSSADLWLLCAGEPAAGSQIKALYRSHDGGRAWVLVSSATGDASGLGLPQVGNLPIGGYVAPVSLGHENLAVISPSQAWLMPERGGLYATDDGGSSWHPVDLPGFPSDGYASVVFSDATHGWVDDPSSGVWHTVDAASWQVIGQ